MIMSVAELATTKAERRLQLKNGQKPRHDRVGIPMDPAEYERRRQHAQITVDRYYGPCVYRVIGAPGQMLRMIRWSDQAGMLGALAGPRPSGPVDDEGDSHNPASPW